MKSSATYVPNSQFALLLQGPPKAGKTSLVCAYFPRPYVLDADLNINGALKVFNDLKAAGKVPKDKTVMFDDIVTSADGKPLEECERWTRLSELAKAAILSKDIDTIVVDSLATVVPVLISYILKQSPSKVKLANESMMEIQHWQPFQTLMTRFVMMLRTSGKRFVFCCHEEITKDEVNGVIQYRIAMPSRLQHTFGGLFTDCWRIEQVEDKAYRCKIRCMSTVRMPGLGNTLGFPPEIDPQSSDMFIKAMPK